MMALRAVLPRLICATVLGAALHAQDAPPPAAPPAPNAANTLVRNARLVILDTVVVDAKGNAVTNLTRDDFKVTDNDAPQELRFFDPPGKYTPAADITINSTADLDRLAPRAPVNIIVLDEFNTLFEDIAFARYSLKKFLNAQPAKLPTPTMLVAVNLTKFEVLHDYTQDPQAIIDALDHHFGGNPWQAAGGQWTGERRALSLLTLSRVAEATIGHNGHKNMIWLGRGFPTRNRLNTVTSDEAALHSAVVRVINELRDARVTLYTIDPAGVQTDPYRYGQAAGLFAPFGGDPDFQQMATATGGRNLYGRNDVDAEVGTAIRDGGGLYTLVYRPSDEAQSKRTEYHAIKVTVTRPGLFAITRQGYFPDIRPAQLRSDGTMSNRLKSELLSAESGNLAYDAVPFAVRPKAGETGSYLVELDGKYLPWSIPAGGGPRVMKAIVICTTFDKKDKELHRTATEFGAHEPPGTAPGARILQNIAFPAKVEPDPKAVRIRFVVRLVATGRMGTADFPLDGSVSEVRSRPATQPAAPAAATSSPTPTSAAPPSATPPPAPPQP